jgi:DNA primase
MDVLELLNQKKIPFTPAGKDYKILCLNLEHEDHTPSLHVDRITGIFNCFACGFKGNIFSFFEEKANFLQIRRELFKRKIQHKMAENIGLDMPKNAIPFNKPWRNISAKTYKDFEAFEHSDNDFISRIVFPIRSISGKILGFNGRALTPEKTPKYLIKPAESKFPLFPARVTPIGGRVILVEGIFDMLNLYDKGLTNVVCAFGTRKVTKDKLVLLKVQGVTGIDILFDNDDAGQEATKEVVTLVESLEMTTRTVTLPSGVNDAGELTAQKVLKLKEALYG